MAETTIGIDTAAKLLMLTVRKVEKLTRDGAIERVAPGQYSLVAAVQGYIRFLLGGASGRVPVATLAAHLGLTRQRCEQLAGEGVLERDRDGRFDLSAARLAYIKYLHALRSEPVETDAMRRSREARARTHELKALQLEGKLADINEAQAFVDEGYAAARVHLGAIPARFCARDDIAGKRRLEQMIDEAFAAALADLEEAENEEQEA